MKVLYNKKKKKRTERNEKHHFGNYIPCCFDQFYELCWTPEKKQKGKKRNVHVQHLIRLAYFSVATCALKDKHILYFLFLLQGKAGHSFVTVNIKPKFKEVY